MAARAIGWRVTTRACSKPSKRTSGARSDARHVNRKMAMKWHLLLLLAVAALAGPLTGLAGQPKSFLKGQTSQWQVYELRSDVDFQHAWDAVFDLLIND